MLEGKDVTKMTREELVAEINHWREMAPLVINNLQELHKFRRYGGTVEELDKSILEMRDLFAAAIEIKQQQIDQITEAFNRLRADPLGIDRLNREQPKTRKLH